MPKYIFLDVDGVLNCEQYYSKGRTELSYPLCEFDPLAIEQLNKICEETNCDIILSASMRGEGIEQCRNIFNELGIIGKIVDITPLDSYRHNYIDRGNEIKRWLIDNKKYKYDSWRLIDHDYAIIDDEDDMLYQQRHNFFLCSPNTGLTEEVANKVIKFLNI